MKRYPAKILLFGEYSIVIGGKALAVPFAQFGGNFSFDAHKQQKESNENIFSLLQNFEQHSEVFEFLKLDKLREDVQSGLWFNSDIPRAYGLGSSGALIAALYDCYQKETTADSSILKERLSNMESLLHGSSSGIDPLVCLLQKAIHVKDRNTIDILNEGAFNLLSSVYLVDTKTTGLTKNLVEWFKGRLVYDDFARQTNLDLVRRGNRLIEQVVRGRKIAKEDLLHLSRYQHDYLSPMVPAEFRKHFFAGFESGDFAFKLCGSGGGGYLLCIAFDEEKTKSYLEKEQLDFMDLAL